MFLANRLAIKTRLQLSLSCRRTIFSSFRCPKWVFTLFCPWYLIAFSENQPPKSESIFSSRGPAWDHVFDDIKDMPPLLPSTVRNPLRSPGQRPRRQAMTAREISAFEDMFDIIFNAVSKHKSPGEQSDVGIGGHSDLFGKLRRHSKKLKWTTEADEKLDQQKEAIDLCDSDHQLLEWAMREVFAESEKYERDFRQFIANTAQSGGPPKELPMLQPSTYPHLIAVLMRKFRDRYNDPHLALAIFEHAKHLSIASYVFGCSTNAYNELIETRWRCFRDLKGVHDALQEMAVNGVDFDVRTRKLVDTVRREVGERTLWAEDDSLGSGEAWNMLKKIEGLVMKRQTDDTSGDQQRRWDEWKNLPLEDDEKDGWGFDQWEPLRKTGSTSEA